MRLSCVYTPGIFNFNHKNDLVHITLHVYLIMTRTFNYCASYMTITRPNHHAGSKIHAVTVCQEMNICEGLLKLEAKIPTIRQLWWKFPSSSCGAG